VLILAHRDEKRLPKLLGFDAIGRANALLIEAASGDPHRAIKHPTTSFLKKPDTNPTIAERT